MALTYLSGDDAINGKKKKASGGGSGGSKRKPKKTKEQKKAGRKRVFKKVAKVAVAPARAAFLTACTLNLLKLSTKLVRVWNKPSGKATLTKFWEGFGGNMAAFKKAVAKGSKQQINADMVGVAATAVLATATPIIVALVPIIKSFKAAGSEKEAQEFNEGVNDAKKDLAENDDVPKSKVSMPKNKDAGIVVEKDGEAQEDEKETKKARKESDTGGNDSESGEDEKKKLTKSGADDDKSDAEKEAEKKLASNFSPLGLFFMTLMYLMFFKPSGIVFELVGLYCFVGMLLIPVATTKNPLQKFAAVLVLTPINLINNFNLKIKTKWQNYFQTNTTTATK